MNKPTGVPVRVLVGGLVLSAAGFASWLGYEGFTERPVIPTKGDVPTIGHGSTRYEDGTPVRMSDVAITRERAAALARNLHSEEEARFRASIPGVMLTQGEYDLYVDFTGQYGIGNWRGSSMRRALQAGQYRAACDALLLWKKQAGRDCSQPRNWGPQGCKGVWTRQQERHAKCVAELGP
ncbi:glycoside hydrolase family protein [Stenotrophomonas sp. TWI700]|uniref:glycoside hydrolase family protein n=1 Tax=Stenotrophomonas sp. TWI700 TaxID=3136792 RepID=UPI00320A7DD5